MREVLHLVTRGSGPAQPRPRPGFPAARNGADGVFDSASLLHGHREILIRHGGELYRLRHTRNDKLILTK